MNVEKTNRWRGVLAVSLLGLSLAGTMASAASTGTVLVPRPKPAPVPLCFNMTPSRGEGNSVVCDDLSAVAGLKAVQAKGTMNVLLQWSWAKPASLKSSMYQIQLDGAQIAETGSLGAVSSYTNQNVPAGKHTYKVRARGMSGTGTSIIIHNGPWAEVTIEVKAPCSAPPTVTLSITPTSIWPPNKQMTPVALSGTITQDAGCNVKSATVKVADEYGTSNPQVNLTVSGTGFSGTASVPADRNGDDQDGRHYSFTASVTNEAGTGTSPAATAIVPHDMGGGKGKP